MAVDFTKAHAPLATFSPTLNRPLLKLVQALIPAWLRWNCGITDVTTRNMATLVQLQQEFNQGRTRYILAFRHPTTDDHVSLLYLLAHALPKAARAQGCNLNAQGNFPHHSYFVYDRGIPLWAGNIVNWLFPNLGGIAIARGKLDRPALNAIRQHIASGPLPLMIAPEGGTNGKSELVSPLEPGLAQLAMWAAEDLAKTHDAPPNLVIVPIGIQYDYGKSSWQKIDQLLAQLESYCAIKQGAITAENRYQRLYDLGDYLINWVDAHYQKFYRIHAPASSATSAPLGDRLQNLLDHILTVAEAHFQLPARGTIIDRCRRVEQVGWDHIFRADLADMSQLSLLEKGFADQLAAEAAQAHWHMRIAESVMSVTGNYVISHPSPSRYAETLLLMWRALSRVQNQPFGNSPKLGQRQLKLSVGAPIPVTCHLSQYQTNRSGAKEVLQNLTNALHQSFVNLIEPSSLC